MYVVMNFGVFVCSACAGIHREMTHKVKGISMSTFSDDDLKMLNVEGNAVSQFLNFWSSIPLGRPRETDVRLGQEVQSSPR